MGYTISRSPQQRAASMAEVMRRLMLVKEISVADDATPAGLYLKAAVDAQSTGNTAALIDHPLVADFRDSMLPFGLFERLRASPASLKLPLQVAVAFTVASGSGAVVEEAAPKPLSAQEYALAALDALKAIALFVMTRELARMSQFALPLISHNARKTVALRTDMAALPVLTASAPAIPTPSGNDAIAFRRDMGTLASLIPTCNDSALIAGINDELCKRLAFMSDASGAAAFEGFDATRGGEIGGVLFVPTAAIQADSSGSQIVLIDAAQIAVGDGPIDVRTATSALLQFDDAPDSPPSASTMLRSLFQEGKVAVMAERYFGLRKLRDNSVAVLNGANYG